MTSTLWKPTVATGDAGRTVRVDATAYAKAVLSLGVWSGVNGSALTTASLARSGDANTATHTSPTVTAAAGSWAVTYWADKSSATTAWTAPAGTAARDSSADTGSGRFGSLLVDSGTAVSGSYGGRTATTNATSSNTAMWTVALTPTP